MDKCGCAAMTAAINYLFCFILFFVVTETLVFCGIIIQDGQNINNGVA